MKSNPDKKEDTSPLYSIPGGRYPHLSNDAHVQYLWQFAKAALWPYEAFTESEELACSHLLSAHFEKEFSADKFRDLVERLALASQSPVSTPPVVYLNIRYSEGFAATVKTHAAITSQQRSVPLYYYSLTLLSRIIYECTSGLVPSLIVRHIEQLAQVRQPHLFGIYYRAVVLFQINQPKP